MSWFLHWACFTHQSAATLQGCKRWERRYWQQIWQANIMTLHLSLQRKKPDIHACFLAPQGHLEVQAALDIKRYNESNWEKVCLGSEGCEQIVEGTVVNSEEGMGVLKVHKASVFNCWESFRSFLAHLWIPTSTEKLLLYVSEKTTAVCNIAFKSSTFEPL